VEGNGIGRPVDQLGVGPDRIASGGFGRPASYGIAAGALSRPTRAQTEWATDSSCFS
jgi:hypothetical protein